MKEYNHIDNYIKILNQFYERSVYYLALRSYILDPFMTCKGIMDG